MLPIPSADDLADHGLLTPELRDSLARFNEAETELIVALGTLPRWYIERLEALAARKSAA